MVHAVELLQDRDFMVDEPVHQIFGERPEHRATQGGEEPTRVQGKAVALDIVKQKAGHDDRVDEQLGVVTDFALIHVVPTHNMMDSARPKEISRELAIASINVR